MDSTTQEKAVTKTVKKAVKKTVKKAVKKTAGQIDPLSKLIAANMAKLRRENGMSIGTFAAKVGSTYPHIWLLEHGRIGFRANVILRVAKGLCVHPARLLMSDKEWDRVGPALAKP